jgi:uncharacterized protein (TIGR03086 family)
MDRLDVLDRAGDGFARVLATVGPDQWSRPTPCEDWDVTDLVGHVVAGNTMAAAILHGASTDEAMELFAQTRLGDDPLASARASLEAQAAAFREPGALDRVVHHPVGDLPATQVLGFRIGDLAVHTWDLARATGGDEAMDDVVAEAAWEDLQPLLPVIGTFGVFGDGPSGTLDDDAPLGLLVLDAMGRRP